MNRAYLALTRSRAGILVTAMPLKESCARASGFLEQRQLAGDATSPSERLARNEAFLQLATALESLLEDYRRVVAGRLLNHE